MVSVVIQYSTPKYCNRGAASMKDMIHLFGRCPIGGRVEDSVCKSLDMDGGNYSLRKIHFAI